MENTLLDICANVAHIMTYLHKKGVLSISGDEWRSPEKIHLNEDVFKAIFPDAVPDDDGFAYAEYDGVKIVAIIKEAIRP